MRRWCVWGASVVTLGAVGCDGGEPAGRMVVGLTTDMAVGFELTEVRVNAEVNGEAVIDDVYSYASGDLKLPGELVDLPMAIDSDVSVKVEGYGKAGELKTRRAAFTRVEVETPLLLPLALESSCEGVFCGDGQTCLGGICGDATIPNKGLLPYDSTWVDTAPDACKNGQSGEPGVTIGKGQSSFAPLQEGEALPIEPGPQGGHHMWLALQVRGLRQQGTVLTLSGRYPDLNEDLQPVNSVVTLRKGAENGCEIYGIRFQVDHGLEVATLYNKVLVVQVKLVDPNQDSAEAQAVVTIAP
ncbi:MAG: hypothetical protein IPK82_30785 [Polyangiaceae bacterium]|nr:hypothetical protein [Polyangiaceae bacterium]